MGSPRGDAEIRPRRRGDGPQHPDRGRTAAALRARGYQPAGPAVTAGRPPSIVGADRASWRPKWVCGLPAKGIGHRNAMAFQERHGFGQRLFHLPALSFELQNPFAVDGRFGDGPPLVPVNAQQIVERSENAGAGNAGGIAGSQPADHHGAVVKLRDFGYVSGSAGVRHVFFSAKKVEFHRTCSAFMAASSTVKIATSCTLSW